MSGGMGACRAARPRWVREQKSVPADDEEDPERDDDRENRQHVNPRRDVASTPLPVPQAVRRAAHDCRHAHRSPRVQWVLVWVARPARVDAAGVAAARLPAVLVAGDAAAVGLTTAATPTIMHGAPKFLCRPIGFHATQRA